jgi:hypothetical protein
LHGENYASGYGLKGYPYYFKKEDIEPLNLFKSHIEKLINRKPELRREVLTNTIDK